MGSDQAMLRTVLLAAAVASASAFAPMGGLVRPKARTAAVSSLKMQGDFSDAVPFLKRPINLDGEYAGDVGFDPLGFSDVFDLRVLREAELKHGRFAMLAVLGFIVQETYTLPFFPKMAPVDAHDYFVQQGGGSQIIFWISFVEIFGVVALFETLQGKPSPVTSPSTRSAWPRTRRPSSATAWLRSSTRALP